MALKKNFSVGLFGSIWSALLGLAVVPLYIKYLGTEAYGLIGFFATTQALLQLLDLGLSPTINREVARCSATNNMQEAKSLLYTLSIVYWGMAFVIGLIILVLAPFIATHWLQAKALPATTVTQALMLMGLVVACRWPIGLYMGALMGMQRVALSSIINTAFGTLSSLGAVAVLILISPTVKAFFIWQACVGVGYALTMQSKAWRIINPENTSHKFSVNDLKRIWKFSAGMSALVFASTIMRQFDKILLSKMLSLESFGQYTLAWIAASGLYILITPIFNSIYPRFTSLASAGDSESLSNLYRLITKLTAIVLFPIAILAGLFAKDILYLWTQNQDLAVKVAPLLYLLLIGTAINGIMFIQFALHLAYGAVRLSIKICLILILSSVPMTILFAIKYGAEGGALSWLTLNSINLLVGTYLTHRVMLKKIGLKWITLDVLVPFVLPIMVLPSISEKVLTYGFTSGLNLVIALLVGLITILLLVLLSPSVSSTLLKSFQLRT